MLYNYILVFTKHGFLSSHMENDRNACKTFN